MILKRHKLTNPEMIGLGIVGALCIAASVFTLKTAPAKNYEIKMEAATQTREAYREVKTYRQSLGIEIDNVDDLTESGLLGVESSPITTVRGNLESKLTSINPNWAAYIVDLLDQTGVKKGDAVLIGLTGSFPALDIATIIAIQCYGAKPVWIASEGSSSYGANIPGLTWMSIENLLVSKGFLKDHAIAAAVGGGSNVGGGLALDAREILKANIIGSGVTLVDTLPLTAAIAQEEVLFENATKGMRVPLFINIGGGISNLGTSGAQAIFTPGIQKQESILELEKEPFPGNMTNYLKKGLSVIDLRDIPALARMADLPLAPAVMAQPGDSDKLFKSTRYIWWVNLIMLIGFFGLVVAVAWGLTDNLMKNPRKEEML